MTAQPLDLNAIRARCDAATAGPWSYAPEHLMIAVDLTTLSPGHISYLTAIARVDYIDDLDGETDDEYDARIAANAEFVAHARADVPALLAALQTATERAEDYQSRRNALREQLAAADTDREVLRAERADAYCQLHAETRRADAAQADADRWEACATEAARERDDERGELATERAVVAAWIHASRTGEPVTVDGLARALELAHYAQRYVIGADEPEPDDDLPTRAALLETIAAADDERDRLAAAPPAVGGAQRTGGRAARARRPALTRTAAPQTTPHTTAQRAWETPMTTPATHADQWNANHPIGTPVHAWPGSRDDQPMTTRTRTPAWTLGHGAAVVSVEGHAGGISLGHIRPCDSTGAPTFDPHTPTPGLVIRRVTVANISNPFHLLHESTGDPITWHATAGHARAMAVRLGALARWDHATVTARGSTPEERCDIEREIERTTGVRPAELRHARPTRTAARP